MNITIEVTYSKDEVAAMVLSAHVGRFGAAPHGMKWDVEYSYRGYEVRAVDAKETETASE
jgi:hypothetical protein